MSAIHNIFGLGTVVVDHQIIIEKHPKVDEKTTVLSDQFQVGGPVPTALAVLSLFGHKAHFIGEWGEDPFGKMILDDFDQTGIHFSSHSSKPDIQTGFAHVWIEKSSGSRTISCKRPENEFELSNIDKKLLSEASVLHLDGWPEMASLEAARIVKENGGKVFLDTGSMKPATKSLLPFVDVLNCPRHFPDQMFGNNNPIPAGHELLKYGPQIVTITQGKEGVHLFTDNSHQQIPSIEIQPVDTTGAGDVFCGALIYALLEDQSPEEAVRFASVTAALKCKNMGNREAIPLLAEVKANL